MMEKNKMPYWIWACIDAKELDYLSQPLVIGELFTAIVDRLDDHEMDISGVLDGFVKLGELMGHYSCGQWGETAGRFRDQSHQLMRYAELLKSSGNERDYRLLKEISCSIFADIMRAHKQIEQCQIDPEPFGQMVAQLQAAIADVVERFKVDVLHRHAAYFRRDGWSEPVHLGYAVSCILAVEKMAKLLRLPVSVPASTFSPTYPRSLLGDLLDWSGDFCEREAYYWRQELDEITGVGGVCDA